MSISIVSTIILLGIVINVSHTVIKKNKCNECIFYNKLILSRIRANLYDLKNRIKNNKKNKKL